MRASALVSVAIRNVFRNRRRSILSALAVFLGVFAIIFMRGYLDGFQGAMLDDAVKGQVGAVRVHRAGYLKQVFGLPLQLDVPADDAFLARLSAIEGVTGAAPRLSFGGMLSLGDETRTTLLTAIDPSREFTVCPGRADRLSGGAFLSQATPDGLVLSTEMAQRLGLKQGAQVAVLSPDRDGSLNAVEARLTGTIGKPGAPGMEAKLGIITLAVAQELLRMPGRATEIALGVEDLSDVDDVRDRVAAALGAGYEVITWRQAVPALEEAFTYQDVVLGFVSLVFLVIALIGISNTMLMSVLERTREIGVLMAIGLRRHAILGLFLAEAATLAVLGAAPGALAAIGLSRLLREHGLTIVGFGGGKLVIHPGVDPREVALALTVCVTGTILASLGPAWRASRLRPVEALTAP